MSGAVLAVSGLVVFGVEAEILGDEIGAFGARCREDLRELGLIAPRSRVRAPCFRFAATAPQGSSGRSGARTGSGSGMGVVCVCS